MKYFLQMHKRLGPNQQTLRTLWTNGPLLLSRQERSERTSPFLPVKRSAIIRINDITEASRMEQELVQADKMISLGILVSGMA